MVMMRVLLAVVLCAAPAWARTCGSGSFWSAKLHSCQLCTRCPSHTEELMACQPFQDTVCELVTRAPPAPATDEEAHLARLTEERLRFRLEHADQSLQAERTQLESLVFEWQTTVFVVSILVTFALVFSFLAVLLRRTGTVVKKGVEDYSHLLLNREDEHRDGNDQGSLAFADFNAIKIGRRPFDSPYSDLSAPRREAGTSVSAAGVADYSRLPRHQV